jgi:hypothetical protein
MKEPHILNCNCEPDHAGTFIFMTNPKSKILYNVYKILKEAKMQVYP